MLVNSAGHVYRMTAESIASGCGAVDWQQKWMRPDTTDPATLGCILALVRDAWGNPTIHTQASGPFWIVVAGAGWSGDDLTGEQDGEAAALLAALEAAP